MRQKLILILLGPLILLLSVLALSAQVGTAGAEAVGVLLWMVFWWVTRPVNITVTALLPIVMNGLLGIVPMGNVTSQYFSDSIILIFGSGLLTLGWELTGLDRRVSLKVLSVVGPSMKSQITVWLLASMILSTTLPNVAVCALFTPIACSMLRAAGYEDIRSCKPAVPILLAIGWGVSLGGVGSPLGGAMNVAAISFFEQLTGHEFMYIDWIVRMLPIFLLVMAAMWLSMILLFRSHEPINGTREYFQKSYAEMGPMKRDEKICGILFCCGFAAAFARPFYASLLPGLSPAYAFLTLGILSFFLTAESGEPLLLWEKAEKGTMWGMMILFGGGLALGKMLNDSGATGVLASVLSSVLKGNGYLIVAFFVILATLISELTNSTVSSAVVIPIVLGYATELGVNPVPLWFITIMGFNSEFLLPVSVRAIPIAYGLDASKMMKYGIPMMIVRTILVLIVGFVCMNYWPFFSRLSYM